MTPLSDPRRLGDSEAGAWQGEHWHWHGRGSDSKPADSDYDVFFFGGGHGAAVASRRRLKKLAQCGLSATVALATLDAESPRAAGRGKFRSGEFASSKSNATADSDSRLRPDRRWPGRVSADCDCSKAAGLPGQAASACGSVWLAIFRHIPLLREGPARHGATDIPRPDISRVHPTAAEPPCDAGAKSLRPTRRSLHAYGTHASARSERTASVCRWI
jgi:hypothetical protein